MAISLAYCLLLSVFELAIFVPLLPKTDPSTIVKECGSFLIIKNNTVNVIHTSAKDYLEKQRSRLRGVAIRGHADIVGRSIDAMSSRLIRDVYHL